MPTEDNDPAVGDPVILKGRIKSIDEGVALVEVYRSYPLGCTVPVQCGALELDETPHDDDTVPGDEERIRDVMTEAMDHPGRIVTR